MKFLSAVVGAQAVEFHDDKAGIGHFTDPAVPGSPTFRRERPVRPCIDAFNYRIVLCWVEIVRAENDSVNVILFIAAFCDETLGSLPAGCEEVAEAT